METFNAIINLITVTFDQFNKSLLNGSIHFFKKKKEFLLIPNFLTIVYIEWNYSLPLNVK